MKKRILSVLTLFSVFSFGQTHQCTADGTSGISSENPKTQTCTNSSSIYTNTLSFQENWTATSVSEKKTLRYRIHIMQDANGLNNWPDNANSLTRLNQVNLWLNKFYSHVDDHSMVIPGVVDLDDAQFGFDLLGVHFYQDQAMHQSTSQIALQNYITNNFPERNDAMHVFITAGNFFATGYSFFPPLGDFPNTNSNRSIWTSLNFPNDPVTGDAVDYFLAQHLAHEFGHSLDLRHMYNHEFCKTTDKDFLDDVFVPNFPGTNPSGSCDVEYYSASCDLNDPNAYCTNNLMAGKGLTKYYISPKQIGRIHRVARFDATREFIWGYSQTPYEITSDQTWDFSIKMYEDLVVKSGNTLTVTCEIQMVPEASIIIEPGAELILDGGVITNAKGSDEVWQGIQVHGNSNLNQYGSSNQGKLTTKNGAIIENAYNAVKVWKPGDYSTTGGVLNCRNTTFRNNWRSVEYISYRSYSNSGNEIKNLGRFSDCIFDWNDNYLKSTIAGAVTMNNVNGVLFTACEFDDQRITTIVGNVRPYGIYVLDAGFKVVGRNLGGPSNIDEMYSEAQYDISSFRNLSAGIYASNSYAELTITLDHAKMTDCTRGLDLRGLEFANITRNNFIYSLNNPSDINTMRGVHLYDCNGYKIEGNIFDRFSNNSTGFVGVIVYRNGVEQNVVYKNEFNNLFVANFASGHNNNGSSNVNFASGLQWVCNDYVGSVLHDQYDISNGTGSTRGVRLLQGTAAESAGNKFSSNLTTGTDYQFNSIPNLNKIYYQSNGSPAPLVNSSSNVGVFTSSNSNSCISSFKPVIKPKSNDFQINYIESLKEEVASLQSELFNKIDEADLEGCVTMLGNLETVELSELRTKLEESSPYLTKEILMTVAESSLGENVWLYDLFVSNIEKVSSPEFINYLLAENLLPIQMIQSLVDLSETAQTEYGVYFHTITNLTEKIEEESIKLYETYDLDSIIIKSKISELIELKDDMLKNAELIDYYLTTNMVKSDSLIALSLSQLSDLEGQSQTEMEDFLVFKEFQKTLLEDGHYTSLTQDEITLLEFYAENLTGRGQVQAENILCFFTGNCKQVEDIVFDKSISGDDTRFDFELYSSEIKIANIYPNPNNGLFSVEIEKNQIVSVEIFGTDGQRVENVNSRIFGNLAEITIQDNLKLGVYFIKILDETGTYSEGKLIVQ